MKPLIIAHRGASGRAPENTLAAFRLAIEDGADWIEFDLHQSADGRLVVIHDFTLKRTGGSALSISAHTLDRIKEADVGRWKDRTFTGERVPTLEEVLELARDRVGLQIEIKRGSPGYPHIERRLAEILRQRKGRTPVAVSSFDLASLKTFRKQDPSIPLGLLTRRSGVDDILAEARGLGVRSVHLSSRRLTPAILKGLQGEGFSVYTYTVNDESEMQRFIMMGVDGLFTDHPARLRDLLERPGSPPMSPPV